MKTDPFSRRIILTAWNPNVLDKVALPPCHIYVQFYVEEKLNKNYLSCHFHARSADLFLGIPFNICSYTVLLHIIAIKVNMIPDELIITLGDAHIYKNHEDQVKLQITRRPYPFPKLRLSTEIREVDFHDMKIEFFSVENYTHHPTIHAQMCI